MSRSAFRFCWITSPIFIVKILQHFHISAQREMLKYFNFSTKYIQKAKDCEKNGEPESTL